MNTGDSRVLCAALRGKIMPAEQAAALIPAGANIGMSGFTGAGYPKVVPVALARRIREAGAAGRAVPVGVWSGADTGPELDGALAAAGGLGRRLPYQSDPACRNAINAGAVDYLDMHLSHVAQVAAEGFLGPLDVAIVEVTAILEDGRRAVHLAGQQPGLARSQAQLVILEVNAWQNPRLEGMHDIYAGPGLPPHRRPIPITATGDDSAAPISPARPARSPPSWKRTPPTGAACSRRRTRISRRHRRAPARV